MKRIRRIPRLVRSFSERTEFLVVLVVAFVVPIWNSIAAAFSPGQFITSDFSRLLSCAIQVAILGFVVLIGRIRGWSIRELGLHATWRLTAMGILLFLAIAIILFGVSAAIYWLAPGYFNHPRDIAIGLSFVGILATVFINPFFEETLVCAYVIQRLANKGAVVAISFSAFVRFLYHAHLGPSSVGPLLMGLIFGYLFWRFRQLWPLIVAHSLVDLVGFLLLARNA
jgi:membrane protease YdiL (CAAX protease family)